MKPTRPQAAVLALFATLTGIAAASLLSGYYGLALAGPVAAVIELYRALAHPPVEAVLATVGMPSGPLQSDVFWCLGLGFLTNSLASDYAHPRYLELPRWFRAARRAWAIAFTLLVAGVVAAFAATQPGMPLGLALVLAAGPLIGLLVAWFQSLPEPTRGMRPLALAWLLAAGIATGATVAALPSS